MTTVTAALGGLRFIKFQTAEACDFDIEDTDLKDFFNNHVEVFQTRLLATTYCVKRDGQTIAMFSLCNDSIAFSEKMTENLFPPEKRLRAYPAVKIARLGVCDGCRGEGTGTKILSFLKFFFIVKNKTACRFLTVDAYNRPRVLRFYEDAGFQMLPIKGDPSKRQTLPMFLDLIEIRNWLYSDADAMADAVDTVSEINLL